MSVGKLILMITADVVSASATSPGLTDVMSLAAGHEVQLHSNVTAYDVCMYLATGYQYNQIGTNTNITTEAYDDPDQGVAKIITRYVNDKYDNTTEAFDSYEKTQRVVNFDLADCKDVTDDELISWYFSKTAEGTYRGRDHDEDFRLDKREAHGTDYDEDYKLDRREAHGTDHDEDLKLDKREAHGTDYDEDFKLDRREAHGTDYDEDFKLDRREAHGTDHDEDLKLDKREALMRYCSSPGQNCRGSDGRLDSSMCGSFANWQDTVCGCAEYGQNAAACQTAYNDGRKWITNHHRNWGSVTALMIGFPGKRGVDKRLVGFVQTNEVEYP